MDPGSSEEAWLWGYAVGGIGGIAGDDPVRIGPLARMNFLVGRNNHGKSTILRAAGEWVSSARTSGRRDGPRETLTPILRTELHRALRGASQSDDEVRQAIARFPELDESRIGVWAHRDREANTTAQIQSNAVWSAVKAQLGLANYSLNRPFTISPHVAARSVTIPAFRELRAFEPDPEMNPSRRRTPDLASGEGLVAELSKWERPTQPGSTDYRLAKERWLRLRAFVRDVLEDPEAELEVANQTDLHVRLAQAGAMLHIDSLGDGVKQVLMIGAACIYFDDSLVLLEEPEIHLHAGLQRKLLRFLASQTRSQYIVATHSAHVLDLPGARIFHVTHDGHFSRVTSTVRASDVHRVCQDLGYMASDLLQSNYTIWVEGPSDRVYWRAWLKLIDPELEEGVHYSVMTYGGYLVDGLHLRDEHDVESDLISLLRLGRNCTLIADSDKRSPDTPLRDTVVRLMKEAEQPGSGDVLVCDWASTVENLVPRGLFRETVMRLHPQAGRRLKSVASHTPFDDPFLGVAKSTFSKVRIAREICDVLAAADVDTRLKDATRDLARSIRVANGMPALAEAATP